MALKNNCLLYIFYRPCITGATSSEKLCLQNIRKNLYAIKEKRNCGAFMIANETIIFFFSHNDLFEKCLFALTNLFNRLCSQFYTQKYMLQLTWINVTISTIYFHIIFVNVLLVWHNIISLSFWDKCQAMK